MVVTPERAQSRLLTLATIIAVVAVLYFAREVLIPLAMAILVSFLLAPIVSRLQRWGMKRIPAVLSAVAVASAAVFVVAWVFLYQMVDLSEQLPLYKENIVKKIETLQHSYSPWLRRASQTIDDVNSQLDGKQPAESEKKEPAETDANTTTTGSTGLGKSATALKTLDDAEKPLGSNGKPVAVRIVSGPTSVPEILNSYVGPILAPIGTAAVIAVLAIFILIEREDLRNRFIRLIGDRQLHQTTDALDDASTRVSRYLLMQLIVNMTYGICVSIGLWFIGMPNVAIWGLLSTVLRFIPYIGPWIAAAMPIALSLAIFDGWIEPLLVIGVFIVLELLSNNVMEPMLYGSSTGISAFGIIISAVFWTWLWGGVGLVLATPLTVCMMVLGRHVPQFRYLEVVLGDQPPLPFSASVYQRLLALDEDEVAITAKKYLREHSLAELFDEVFVPALQHANQDHQLGRLDDARWNYVHDALRELIVDLQEEAVAVAAKVKLTADNATDEQNTNAEHDSDSVKKLPTPEVASGKIICLAARDLSDELAGQMLAVLLLAEGYQVEVLASRDIVAKESSKQSATTESVAEQPRMIWISALPPLADARVRELCRQWTQRQPRAAINVGLWRESLHERNKVLLHRAGAREITTLLRNAVLLTNQYMRPVKIEPVLEAEETKEVPETTADLVDKKSQALAG